MKFVNRRSGSKQTNVRTCQFFDLQRKAMSKRRVLRCQRIKTANQWTPTHFVGSNRKTMTTMKAWSAMAVTNSIAGAITVA